MESHSMQCGASRQISLTSETLPPWMILLTSPASTVEIQGSQWPWVSVGRAKRWGQELRSSKFSFNLSLWKEFRPGKNLILEKVLNSFSFSFYCYRCSPKVIDKRDITSHTPKPILKQFGWKCSKSSRLPRLISGVPDSPTLCQYQEPDLPRQERL